MIEGIKIIPLKQIVDDRGKIMHMLRNDDDNFIGFGEIYFSCVQHGKIKAWHLHEKMILNYAVPYGNIKLVLYDPRINSKTKGNIQEISLGEDNYCLVTIPPKIWSGFVGISLNTAIVANCSTIPHDPNELKRLDPLDPLIPYNW